MSDPDSYSPEAAHRAAALIHLALMLGLALFAVVVLILIATGGIQVSVPAAVSQAVAWTAIGLPLVGFLMRRAIRSGSAPKDLDEVSRRWGRTVAALGVMEAGGLLGVLNGMMTGSPGVLALGIAPALVAMALSRPTREEFPAA